MQPGERGERYEPLETLHTGAGRVEQRARDRTLGREVLLVRRERATLAGEPGGDGRALREARALAKALAALHATAAVHRDESEANVLLRPEGGVCLRGFRLAKPLVREAQTSLVYRGRSSAAQDGAARADLPTYPAPEQLEGEAASPRSDLFALGCVLYRALTGEPAQAAPLEGWRRPQDPTRLRPQVPRGLARLVMACLAHSPLHRPRSAAELAAALRNLGETHGTRERRAPRAWPVAVAGACALLALAAGAWFLGPGARSGAATPDRGLALEPSPARAAGAPSKPASAAPTRS